MKHISFAVMVCTYNRLDCLKIALEAYEKNTVHPDYFFVLDNASTDGTREFLENWVKDEKDYKKYIHSMETNNGSAVGFNEGITRCMSFGADWIFAADDDAYPDTKMIENLRSFIDDNDCDKYAAITTKVINKGEVALVHRRRVKKGLSITEYNVPKEEYDKPFFEFDEFSYVGTAMNRKAVEKYGATRRDLYVFIDDTEHSLRLKKYGPIICVPSAAIIHDKDIGSKAISWRTYYHVRNHGIVIKDIFGKFYFWSFILPIYLKNVFPPAAWIKKMGEDERILLKDALHDAIYNVTGPNEKYAYYWGKLK